MSSALITIDMKERNCATANWLPKFLCFIFFLGDLVHLAYSGLTKNSSFVKYVRDGLVKKVHFFVYYEIKEIGFQLIKLLEFPVPFFESSRV